MSSINGKFLDQNPIVLSAQLVTARTTVKTDLNTLLAENDQIRATNTFLVTQNIGNSNAGGGIGSAVAQTVAGTIGAAQTAGEIGSGGGPCFLGNAMVAFWHPQPKYVYFPFEQVYRQQHHWKNVPLLSFDDDDTPVKGELAEVFCNVVHNYLHVSFDDGTADDVVAEHRYYTPSSIYIPIKYLLGKEVVSEQGVPQTVQSIHSVYCEEGINVYNLRTPQHQNYSVNKRRVHNAKNPPELENPEVI